MLNEIRNAFSEIDQKMHDTQLAWAMGRMDALKEYRTNYDRKSMCDFITEAVRIAGGKTWYAVFKGRGS